MSPTLPTPRAERIGMLDTNRGIAVLGILLMNIVGFGLPEAYEIPINWGGHEGANLWAWRINAWFFEGTMRGLFTLLFGAGALLFLQRQSTHDATGTRELSGTALYFRRTGLLILFGLINAYVFLWEGDILFYYGVTGLFLYFFRNLRTPTLILIGLAVLTVPTIMNLMERVEYTDVKSRAEAATIALESGAELTDEQLAAINELHETQADRSPAQQEMENAIARVKESYASAFHYLRNRTFYWETTFFIRYGFAECLGMMLIGMALLKLGILSGSAPRHVYAGMMAAGYAIGLGVNLWETRTLENSAFSIDAVTVTYLTYDLGRVPLTLAHLGLIGWLWQLPILHSAKRVLARVGQMALTNYLTQSIICGLLFTGAGLGLFGQFQRYELYYFVVAIWVVQLLWSPWWLNRFQFGPAEWLWRSLTYGRRQPMRIAPHAAVTVDHRPST
ncbi:DUF418 domain-containing protein [Povalibacter sp.]|uniref:DUF418 domain-containing protein n=1 Tax=Povalibacter sp. TaxID=1962978 RepID=UPI002F411F27